MKKKHLLISLILIILSAIIYNCSVNPVTGKKELSLMSERQEVQMGEQHYPVFTQIYNGLYPDDNLQKYVQKVGERLAKESHRPNLNYEFNVLNTSIPNAFALPGGKVSITRGLLNILDSEDQLAGILGHEIGHITARHSAKRYSQGLLAQAALLGAAYLLDNQDIKGKEYLIKGGAFGTQLLLLRYSRDNEREADNLGIQYMTKGNYNPTAYSEVMEKFLAFYDKEPSKYETIFSTHPLSSERVKDAINTVNKTYSEFSNKPYKINTFMTAMQTIKNNEEAYNNYDQGVSLFDQKKYEEAKPLFQKAIDLFDRDAIFHYHLAYTEYNLKKYDAAKKHSDAAIALYPDFFYARTIKGKTEYELKNYNEAINNLNTANNLISDLPEVVYYLALSYDGKKDFSKALDYYKKIIELTEDETIIKYANKRIEDLEN